MSNRDFAFRYGAVVAPRLRQMCRFRGFKVACRDETFSAACAEITHEAWRLGGAHLPERLWDVDADNGRGGKGKWIEPWEDLSGQLEAWLLEAIEAAIPAVDEAEALAEKVAIDVARYFRAWEAVQE